MSNTKIPRGPKIIVGFTTLATLSAIVYSHYSQIRDKSVMRAGVERDKERMRLKRLLKKEEQQ
jgi:hypothetical protein